MDKIFKALNDPARRALLDSLRDKDGQSLSELETLLEMTRFGVMKHLGVLEEAGLITSKKVGRFKYHYLNALPLQEVIDRWIEPLLTKPTARAVLDLKAQLEGTAQMFDDAPAKPDFMMQTYIRCTQDALWDALTNEKTMAAYHFMATAIERAGETLSYYLPGDELMLVCTETKLEPKSRIESSFEPKWAGPDMAASRYVYLIEVTGAFCKLTLEHYDIPADQGGVADGWARELSGLKTFLETGEVVRFNEGTHE